MKEIKHSTVYPDFFRAKKVFVEIWGYDITRTHTQSTYLLIFFFCQGYLSFGRIIRHLNHFGFLKNA